MRKWRLRSRKAQVSAVATILGLLLVVTYIANYLSTTLPSQMGTNDLDHVLQVENQMGQFQALLEQYSAAGAVGAPVTQPVTLGSQGLPPFADADFGSIGPLNGSSYTLSYELTGPATISPQFVRSAGIDVHLLNTYAPQADIAFDAGAVLYAQPGGTPLVIDPPGLSVVRSGTTVTAVTIWVPTFLGSTGSQSGIGTAELSARLVALSSISLTPTSSYTVADNTDITFSVVTPFAAGWWSYFNATYPASWIGCSGAGCNGPYSGLGDYGTITLTIPTGTDLNYFDLDLATFAFQPL